MRLRIIYVNFDILAFPLRSLLWDVNALQLTKNFNDVLFINTLHVSQHQIHEKVRPHGQKFSRTTWYNMVVRHKTCRGRGSVDGMGDVCRATFYVVQPCCATKIVNCQMSVHFKRNSGDIMVSQRCYVLSNIIWTYFCHFLRCSRAKFIKKILDVWTLVT